MAITKKKAKAKKSPAKRNLKAHSKKAPTRRAAEQGQPPAPPTGPGTWAWHELLTRDTRASKEFYTSLFGWRTEEMQMPGMTYTLFNKGKGGVGGMMAMSGPDFEGVAPHWLVYLHVEDVDAAAAKATSLGATVLAPPADIPNIGRFSVIRDPTEAVFAIFTPKM